MRRICKVVSTFQLKCSFQQTISKKMGIFLHTFYLFMLLFYGIEFKIFTIILLCIKDVVVGFRAEL